MRKLAYFILGLILLFVIIFAFSPWLIGNRVQSYVAQTSQTIQQKYPGTSVEVVNYNKHWFSSDATFKVTYRVPLLFSSLGRSNPITLTFNAHITHGPIVGYTRNGSRHHTLAKSAIVLTSPNMQGNITVVANWNNSVNTIFDVERFKSDLNQSSLTLQNLMGHLDYAHGSQDLHYDVTIGQFIHTITSAQGKDSVNTTNSKLKGTLSRQDDFWAGTLRISRDSVNVTRNNTLMLGVKNITADYSSKVHEGRADLHSEVKAADVTFAGEQYGSLGYTASMLNADIPSLNKLIDAAKKLYLSNDVSMGRMIAIYAPLSNLVEKGLTLNVQNFKLDLPDQDPITFTASIQFIQAPQDINFLNIFNYMSATGNVSMPREFVLQQFTEFFQDILNKQHNTHDSASHQAQQALDEWIANKMLIQKTKDLLEMQFSVKQGKLLINDHEPNFELTQPQKPHTKK